MRKLILLVLVAAAVATGWVPTSEACWRRKRVRCRSYFSCPQFNYPGAGLERVAPSSQVLISPKGNRYRVIATNDRGNFEHDLPLPSLKEAAPSDGEHFNGHARQAAKTSFAQGETESFARFEDLVIPLLTNPNLSDAVMRARIHPNSARVNEEQRNITVKAFLYATKKEADNDYHLLLGPHPSMTGPQYMTAEISGLPVPDNVATGDIATARSQFKAFFSHNNAALPDTRYKRFDPPVPVEVSGSLFFDIDHRPGDVGTGSIVPQSVWEIHPIRTIVFEP